MKDKYTMKILYDDTLSTKRLPKSHTLLLNPYVSPAKLNIKLKTHSLTCLDIPLETLVGFKELSSSFRNDHQKTMAGSVDLISEIQQQSDDENFSSFSSAKPLINLVSSNKQQPSVEQEWQPVLKHRFRMATSFITSTSLNDSVARLRRSGHLQNIHQSSSQTIDKITERKHRLPLTRNGSIPKFTFRDLPSNSRPSSSSTHRFAQSSKSRMSPFTSLPEIRSFVAQNCSDNSKTLNDKLNLPPSPSWKKSGSWSWKSNNANHLTPSNNEQPKPNFTHKELQHQIDDHFRSNLPVIIESPLQQRSSLQIINQNDHHSPMRLTNLHHSNLSVRSDKLQHDPLRLYQKKNSFPHSISNYEVSPNRFSSQPTTRYPSTPLLAYPRHKNIDKSDYHPYQLHMSPLATFDDEDDNDDSDSILSNSSFRSCLNSINEFSDVNTTELSSLSERSFQEMSSSYDLTTDNFNKTIKHSRSSIRHICTLQ